MEEDRKMITHQVEVNNTNPRMKSRREKLSMRQKLEASQKTHSYPKKPPTIHRVPGHIRKGDESAYQPQIISIGPYHRSENLQVMESHKWRYLQDFLSRNKTICLEKCLEEIQSLEESVRNCYSETIDLESNEFVEMMVLDGCFILELFLKQNGNTESDPIFNTRWMLPAIRNDMLLLENQLPFFILKRLFELIETSNRESKTSLEGLAVDFFRISHDMFWKIKSPHLEEIHHLLHLLHSSLLPDSKQENSSNHSRDASVKLPFTKWKNSSFKHVKHTPSACSASSELSNEALSSPRPPPPKSSTCAIDNQRPWENLEDDPIIRRRANKWEGLAMLFKWKKILREMLLSLRASSPSQPLPQPPKSIPGATELHGAGVKFKTKKQDESFFLEVKFRDGVMLIPHLLIDCNTNSLFRNFIAFEQCYPKSDTHFTSYAFFMDCIVNTARDVALLGQHKIIEHWLGSDGEVALLFNRLCCGVAIDTQNSYLKHLFTAVTNYCKTSWHTWRACLMRDYFSNPWAIISFAAAVVILVIGIVQTFLAFISYLQPT